MEWVDDGEVLGCYGGAQFVIGRRAARLLPSPTSPTGRFTDESVLAHTRGDMKPLQPACPQALARHMLRGCAWPGKGAAPSLACLAVGSRVQAARVAPVSHGSARGANQRP